MVPLGIIPRNENSTEGMIEIIEELSKNYGLEDEDEFLFMGGDQVCMFNGALYAILGHLIRISTFSYKNLKKFF